MQENDNTKLIELIEQAACSTNMLSPSDTVELNRLQTIVSEIQKGIEETKDISSQIVEQARGSTIKASDALQKILQNQADDAVKSIESVSGCISILQGLIDQIEKGTVSEPKPESKIESASSPAPQAEAQPAAFSEEDIGLISDFIMESKEHIESAEAGLLNLESKPDDKEVLNMIFRSFHTIKGMAGFLNLLDIGSLAHSAENLLDLARKGDLILEGQNTDAIFESIDMLKKMIGDLKEAIDTKRALAKQENMPALLEKLKALAQGQSLEKVLKTPQGEKRDEKLEAVLSGEAPAAVKEEQTAVQAEPAPAKEESAAAKEEAAPVKQENAPGQAERRDEVPRRSGEERRTEASSDEKIKVSTGRLDNLINMTGELVIAQLMIKEEAHTKLVGEYELNRKVAHQGKIIRELQELSMSMRMVPIEGVFQKMARLVRDLSHKAEKKINFVTRGEETELDRNIVDKIADPLVHMVRNSVDHGIEATAEERIKNGKNPAGKVELRAFHQAGNIVIEIEDDGKGLNKERILKKAIDNGLVDPNQQLTDEEIFKLVFHAGLSTAEKVTSISGRGVGMDVVKKNVEALRGKIDIASTPGKGTIFTIRLPLTLAIIDGQIIKVGQERYIIPINSIINTLKPERSSLSSVQRHGEMVMVRGELIPMIRLYKLFNVSPGTEDPTQALVVIVEEEGKKCCLLVDELLGQQQIVIKNLGDGLGRVSGVSGGAIMGDGMVSLILDIPGIMTLAQN
ncbi:MAG: chemotaxis protein CheA [Planctomycetaceae bacterium]|nr:chemotaxis protein CheA [Planctomycetaceae bacterium]